MGMGGTFSLFLSVTSFIVCHPARVGMGVCGLTFGGAIVASLGMGVLGRVGVGFLYALTIRLAVAICWGFPSSGRESINSTRPNAILCA